MDEDRAEPLVVADVADSDDWASQESISSSKKKTDKKKKKMAGGAHRQSGSAAAAALAAGTKGTGGSKKSINRDKRYAPRHEQQQFEEPAGGAEDDGWGEDEGQKQKGKSKKGGKSIDRDAKKRAYRAQQGGRKGGNPEMEGGQGNEGELDEDAAFALMASASGGGR